MTPSYLNDLTQSYISILGTINLLNNKLTNGSSKVTKSKKMTKIQALETDFIILRNASNHELASCATEIHALRNRVSILQDRLDFIANSVKGFVGAAAVCSIIYDLYLLIISYHLCS